MPDPILPITPNPNPPKEKDFAIGSNLSGDNKNILKKNLWRKLFEFRITSSQYTIYDPGETIKVKRIEQTANLIERDSVNKISQLCRDEAETIAEQIFKYIDASKKIVYSAGKNHPTSEYVPNESHEVKSVDYSGIKF